ncbi:disulfide bond formation protein DsbB [Alteromonas sp. C1M14]|uniref:disulfide bond formation protein DsbB n=1 Tax=Alteromonas sp. C1M14 TaxID=2841567 RepID=UPI001C09C0CC|nr:disulfide bond formation protein DsbB [Alteromonas sp. C1M14]MBU2979761.1 disulfide bond formation protein DsbB [Alteromonas sp. C1M14]
MVVIHWISRWAEQKSAWLLLFLSAFGLLATALYFQHVNGLEPCVMCIYQRTAVIGVMLSALLVLIFNHGITRMLGFLGWAVSAGWGFLLAKEHYEIIHTNSFFSSCEIVPNFPSFMPLYNWLPAVFEAKGDCLDDGWRTFGLGMPEWMMVIFGVYAIVFIVVFGCRILDKKPF